VVSQLDMLYFLHDAKRGEKDDEEEERGAQGVPREGESGIYNCGEHVGLDVDGYGAGDEKHEPFRERVSKCGVAE